LVFADANPLDIAKLIFFKSAELFENAITEGPAPLIVTPSAPALRAFSTLQILVSYVVLRLYNHILYRITYIFGSFLQILQQSCSI
jgi:hypothetical protein